VFLLSDAGASLGYFAAALFGVTLGAEVDVIAYLAARHFGLRNFGTIQGALVCATAVGAASGPITAGATFDRYGSYDGFLMLTIALMVISSAIVGTGNSERRMERGAVGS